MKLPVYRSHKLVRAAKIVAIIETEAMSTQLELGLPDGRQLTRDVSHAYTTKHRPQVGGYFVIYADGYESWSPAEAFEKGYTLMEATPDDA